jgi:hypothetical protein
MPSVYGNLPHRCSLCHLWRSRGRCATDQVDTGPLVALFDRKVDDRARRAGILKAIHQPLRT